jgi:hypothetical protein
MSTPRPASGASSSGTARPPLAVCFAGGGAYAYGFNMGIVEGMREAGIELRGAPMIGTSAGSHSVATVSGGLSFSEVSVEWQNYVETVGRGFWVRASDLSEKAYGSAVAEGDAAGVAVRLLTFRRTLLPASRYRLADIVAASSSPFPLARPHKIDGKRYIDGGHRRVASADFAPAADLLLLLTAFASAAQGWVGRSGAKQAKKESRRWEATTGGRVLQVGPDEGLLALPMKGFRALGDMGLGRKAYDLAVPLGRETAERLRREHPAVVDRLAPPTSRA